MYLRRAVLFGPLALFFFLPMVCVSQATNPESLAQGKIIITPRESPDPHFANSVIVLARYDRTGALGLMLHYKTDLKVPKIFPGFKAAEKRTDTIFVGGPVAMDSVLLLMRSQVMPANAHYVKDNLYLTTSDTAIGMALMERPASDLRLFIGYSGWAPGQLESEVRRHGWYIFDYDEALIFDDHPETLWDRLIGKTERRIASLR